MVTGAKRIEMTEEEEDEILYELVLETRAASSGPSEPWDDLESDELDD